MKKFQQWMVVTGAQQCKRAQYPQTVPLEMVKIVTLCSIVLTTKKIDLKKYIKKSHRSKYKRHNRKVSRRK